MVTHESQLVTTSPRRASLTATDLRADRTTIRVRGEHDLSTVGELAAAIVGAIELDDEDLVVDLSDVGFMSAATIGVLVRAKGLLRERQRRLVLRNPSSSALRVLKACGGIDLVEAGRAVGPPTSGSALRSWVEVPAATVRERRTGGGPVPAPSAVGPGRSTIR